MNAQEPITQASPAEPGTSPQPAAVRRRLTLLYLDLSGSKRLAAVMEAEHYRVLLQSLRAIWHAAAQAHAGRVVMMQGDGALLAFGLPLAGEQDGRHAAEAALQVHAAVAALQPPGAPPALLPLQVHSAVHAGTLLLSAGDVELGVFDLAGDVLNTTAHLASQARPGQLLATLPALGPNALFFMLSEGPPDGLALVNRALVDQVRVVLGRSSATRRFDATSMRGLTPFIGRATVLDRLQAFVQAPGRTPQRCLVLQGSAGMGKTRLIEQLVGSTAVHGCLLLRGSCESDLAAEVLQPFVQMLRGWLQQAAEAGGAVLPLPEGVRAQADALQALADPRRAPQAGPDMAAGVPALLQRFFCALARQQPCLLVVDDWQWADDASRQLLQALLAQPDGPALLLASRPREAGRDWVAGATHCTLQPFTPEETASAVRRLLARPDPFLLARIHDYAGGVPLFIEELCHTVSAEQMLQLADSRGAAQGWLATLVVARLERLPADQAAVVRAAAVVGSVVPLHWLAAACGAPPAPLTLLALVQADFLRPDAGGAVMRFKHGITRDAVYESIGLAERMALHRRLQAAVAAEASVDGAPESLEALAQHSQGAGHWAEAARCAELAGDRAMALYALDRARRLYLAAADAIERLGLLQGERARRWCLLANKLGMTCIFDTLALPQALALFQRAVDVALSTGDAGVQARAHYWMAYMLYGHGWPRRAEGHCRAGLALAAQVGDTRLQSQLQATLGQVLTALGRYDDALQWMNHALQSKRGQARQGSSVAVGSAFTLACLGSVLGDRGQFPAARQAFAEALDLLGDTAHPVANSVRSWQVMVLLWQGCWDEALAVADESVRLAQRASALLPMTIATAAGGWALSRGGSLVQGIQQIEEAVQWMEQRQVQFYTSIYRGWLLESLARQGRSGPARPHALRLMQRARAGERLGLAAGCRALALLQHAAGEHAAAWRRLRLARQAGAARGSAREQALNLQCEARLLAAQGELPAALAAGRAAAQAFGGLGMAWHAEESRTWLGQIA